MKTMRRVLKADEVAVEGPLQLSIDPLTLPGGENPSSASAEARARIVQSHAQYAVIELTCPCGKKSYLRCDYAAAGGSSAPREEARA
jgi:hypothetical protein